MKWNLLLALAAIWLPLSSGGSAAATGETELPRVQCTPSLDGLVEAGDKLEIVIEPFTKPLPAEGKVVKVSLLVDGKKAGGSCAPGSAKVQPYFAQCDQEGRVWYTKKTNRSHIKKMGLCLAKHFPHLSQQDVNHVATCESGWSQNSDNGTYRGVFQLGDKEFKSFAHQGPAWMHDEFKRNGWFSPDNIFNASANILAALAHASRYSWKTWECAP